MLLLVTAAANKEDGAHGPRTQPAQAPQINEQMGAADGLRLPTQGGSVRTGARSGHAFRGTVGSTRLVLKSGAASFALLLSSVFHICCFWCILWLPMTCIHVIVNHHNSHGATWGR